MSPEPSLTTYRKEQRKQTRRCPQGKQIVLALASRQMMQGPVLRPNGAAGKSPLEYGDAVALGNAYLGLPSWYSEKSRFVQQTHIASAGDCPAPIAPYLLWQLSLSTCWSSHSSAAPPSA
mmetsp:Transcript_109337/g.189757  ORF Transcript_109337/g.189757 Transcript_109337/m.189757 type:complete len:120 (+) Transcript_109337:362-721(+)